VLTSEEELTTKILSSQYWHTSGRQCLWDCDSANPRK